VSNLPRTPGSYTISGQSGSIVALAGEQGPLWGADGLDLFSPEDLVTLIAQAALNQQLTSNAFLASEFAVPVPNVRFYTLSCELAVTFTNQSQNDCVIVCYPYIQRYTGYPAKNYWINAGSDNYTQQSTATPTAANSMQPEVYGATPFQYPAITQSSKIGKPRTAVLQGGQHHTFKLKYSKRQLWNPQRLFGSGNVGQSYGGVSRGFAFTLRGRPTNGVTNPTTDIGYGSGRCIYALKKTYEYETVILPTHYKDTATAEYEPAGGEHIILPQTGAIVIPSTA